MHGFYRSKKAFLRTRPEAFLSVSQERRLLVTAFVLVLLFSASFFTMPRQALALSSSASTPMMPAYSCPGTTHCYAFNDWHGNINGAITAISVVQLHAGNGIMNNSLWVATIGNRHWMEAGYAVIYNQNSEFWYWAYINDNGLYLEYDSPPLAAGDWNHSADVYIWQVSGSTWNAAVYGNASSWLPNGFTYSSTPNDINIGQELEGTSGSSASTAYWGYNEWKNGGSYHYQTVSGTSHVDYPPYADWVSPPSSGLGGIFEAHCC